MEDLQAPGFSMEAGKQGLALKNLPPSLRQDAGWGLGAEASRMIGMSGLSDEDMIRVAAMSRDNMGHFELVQMAQTAFAG